LKDPANVFWFQYLPDSQTIYVQFNVVRDKPDESIEAFFKRVFAFAGSHPVNRFVLDERPNDGGNNELLLPVIQGFIHSDKVNQPGKLFTIISRHTFSAAMNCCQSHEAEYFYGVRGRAHRFQSQSLWR
jgi:hypothetical protein